MDRRSFLVGSGLILTSAFVDKANWFLRNKNTVVPFVEIEQQAETLYFVDMGNQIYDLRLGIPEYELPDLTYRQWLEKYEYPLNFALQDDKKMSKESLDKLMGWYGVEEDHLDEIAPFEHYHRQWEVTDSPFAEAHFLLRDLDLFAENASKGELLGDLEFIHEHQMHHGHTVGVKSEDALTASLLQARLLELGQNIRVKIVRES